MDFGRGHKHKSGGGGSKDFADLSVETGPKKSLVRRDQGSVGDGSSAPASAGVSAPETPPSTPYDANSYFGSSPTVRSADVSPITPRTESKLKAAVYSAIPVSVTGAASHASRSRGHESYATASAVPPNTPEVPPNTPLESKQSWMTPVNHSDISISHGKGHGNHHDGISNSMLYSAAAAALNSSTAAPPNTPDVGLGMDHLRCSDMRASASWFSPIPAQDMSSHMVSSVSGLSMQMPSRTRYASDAFDAPEVPSNTPMDNSKWMVSPTGGKVVAHPSDLHSAFGSYQSNPDLGGHASLHPSDLHSAFGSYQSTSDFPGSGDFQRSALEEDGNSVSDFSFDQKARMKQAMQTSYDGSHSSDVPPNTPADGSGMLTVDTGGFDPSSHFGKPQKGGFRASGAEVALTPRTENYLRQSLKTSIENASRPKSSKAIDVVPEHESSVPPNAPAMEEPLLSSSLHSALIMQRDRQSHHATERPKH